MTDGWTEAFTIPIAIFKKRGDNISTLFSVMFFYISCVF